MALRSDQFEKGIKKVIGQSKQTARQLQNINNKLRLKPNSIVLLNAKTKLLRRSLKEVQDEVAKNVKKFNEFKASGQNTDALTKRIKNLRGSITRLNQDLAFTKKRMSESFSRTVNRGLLATGAVVAATTIKFNDFNEGIAKIATLPGVENIDGLRQSILDLSNATGVNAKQIAEGWYQALSAGVKQGKNFENEIKFMTTASKLAKAGFGEMGSVVKLLAITSQQTGLAVEKVSDKFLALQNAGVITTGEVAENFGKVLPLANNLGVSLDQVNAVIATFTKQGVDAAQATTLLRSLFVSFNKPTSEVAKILQRVSGKTFPEFIKQGGNLAQAVQIIAKENSNLFASFSNVRAAQAAASLDSAEFTKQLQNQAQAAGTTDKAFGKQQNILKFQNALNKLSNTFIQIGQGIAEQIIPYLEQFVEVLKNIDLKAFAVGVVNAAKAFTILKIALIAANAAGGWIGLLAGVISAVLVESGKLGDVFKWIGDVFKGIYKFIKPVVDALSWILEKVAPVVNSIGSFLGGIGDFFSGGGNRLNTPSTTTNNNITNNYGGENTKRNLVNNWNYERDEYERTNIKLGGEV